MQFLQMSNNLTLREFAAQVGNKNVDAILSLNSLSRKPNLSKSFEYLYREVVANAKPVTPARKISILNTLTSDYDIFEAASLQTEDSWKMLSIKGTMHNMLRIPETIVLPDSSNILGGINQPISKSIYNKALAYLQSGVDIDPIIFNTYSSIKSSQIQGESGVEGALQWFKLPWGNITLYSSLSDTAKDFPVYPEEYNDRFSANYDTMPDMLYQYEPWNVYRSSGPRSNVYEFKIHRDMWTGDHRDGKCNELIRFCEANCYPDYNGAAVVTSTVTLYISGKPLITGIIKDVQVKYSGPLGLDNFPLVVDLSLKITEVAVSPVTHSSMRRRGLIG